jgi:serine/threonine-protein kinase
MKHCPTCGIAADDGAARCALCHEDFPAPDEALLVEGRYQVESTLGRGQQGMVYLARDLNLGRLVALKVLHPSHAATPGAAERLKLEAKALASVRSDHVAQVYSFGPHASTFFLAMEYVEGRNLDALVAEHAAHKEYIPTHRGLTILRQMAHGLASLHAAGIVHRDVKPSNVMIEQGTGRTVLLDLGLARWFAHSADSRLSFVGTPAYMAPEQILGEDPAKIAGHTDVYSLGCTAFELFTGSPPFACATIPETLAHQMWEAPPKLSGRRPELAFLDPVVARALAKDPRDRYATCSEVIDAIDAVCAASPRLDPSGEAEAPSGVPSIRLMVIDDDEVFAAFAAEACALALPHLRLDLVCASSGLEALQAAARTRPDVVVLDYDMPLLDGLETLSYLRAMPGGYNAQVMLVSSNMKHLPNWRFAAMGVTDFLEKPVDLGQFAAALDGVVARAVAQRGRFGGAATL